MTEKMRTYFTIVLDCGSTGSRVNVFEWMIGNGSRVYGNLPVLLRSYPDNVNKSSGCVRASLEPLIRYAEQWVPSERRAATPIFVLATAGMRRLVAEEAKRVLGDVENVVKEHGFLYRTSWVRVLSGKEEAYYGWVALNYKMGVFGKSSRTSTLGLLDLGGSSLQLVAEVDVSMKDKHVFRSKIGPALRESAGGIFEVRHPCLGSGFVQNYTCHGCFGIDSRVNINMSNQVQGSTTKLNLTKTLHTVPRYHALSGFFAVYHALNLSQRANLSMLWESGEKLCSGSWADQKSSNGQYCFRVPYLTSLIENALCLSDIEIIFGPGDVSWTLGASLIEGEFLWLDPEKSQNPMLTLKDYIMIRSPVLIFVLLLSLLLIVYCCQIKLPMPGRKIAGTRTSLPSYLCPKRQLN
ncbi:UNVERIFIED_CONTAM: putative apyrase 7 [Sesamum radiatum]|uniref:Apyrase 7 n=1 Tax=Sesamum radiatum TaxID=300843 RepID=A0AAW2WHB6_SESRA